MLEQNSIVENWILENEAKLKEISVENKPLYETVFLALEYLNNSLGGKVITAPKIEPVFIPELPVSYKKVYLTKDLSSGIVNNISIGSLGMVLQEENDKYLIDWYEPQYQAYVGQYDKTMFTDIAPLLNVGSRVEFPSTQYNGKLGIGLKTMIQVAKFNNKNTLLITGLEFDRYMEPKKKWLYWLSDDNVDLKYGVYLQDLQTQKTAIQKPKPKPINKPKKLQILSTYDIGQEVISKVDPTSIYEIIDLNNTTISKSKSIYKLSSKTDVTKLNYWTTETDLEKDYNISQKKSISLPIKQEKQTQQAEFEELADELDNLEL